MFFQYVLNRSVSRIPVQSEIDIDLIFGTTADKSYHDLVIQNGKTSPIMNSTSPQSKGFGSSYMTNTWLGVYYDWYETSREYEMLERDNVEIHEKINFSSL